MRGPARTARNRAVGTRVERAAPDTTRASPGLAARCRRHRAGRATHDLGVAIVVEIDSRGRPPVRRVGAEDAQVDDAVAVDPTVGAERSSAERRLQRRRR
jgi:hypothetical protein